LQTPNVHIFLDDEGIPRTTKGHVKVKMLALRHLQAQESAAALAEHYGIDLADVYAALAYYYDHQMEMDEQIAHAEALVSEVGVSSADLKARIAERLEALGLRMADFVQGS